MRVSVRTPLSPPPAPPPYTYLLDKDREGFIHNLSLRMPKRLSEERVSELALGSIVHYWRISHVKEGYRG